MKGRGHEKQWPLYNQVNEYFVSKKIRNDKNMWNAEHLSIHWAKSLLDVLEDTARYRCTDCGGVGHLSNNCETHDRLQEITNGVQFFKDAINAARKKVDGVSL